MSTTEADPVQASIFRACRRYQDGFESDVCYDKPNDGLTVGRELVPFAVLVAELTGRCEDMELHHQLIRLCNRGFLERVDKDEPAKCPWAPMEYTIEDGTRIRVCDKSFSEIVVTRNGQPRPCMTNRDQLYRLTPAGYEQLDRLEKGGQAGGSGNGGTEETVTSPGAHQVNREATVAAVGGEAQGRAGDPRQDHDGEKHGPPVILRGADKPVIVLGREKPPLTEGQYRAVEKLIKDSPMKKDLLEKGGMSGTRQALRKLKSGYSS